MATTGNGPSVSESIQYKEGSFKYQLHRDVEVLLPELRSTAGVGLTGMLTLTPGGLLRIRKRYAWDGPSGPVVDRSSTLRASLVHDALYQLMRAGFLDRDLCQEPADRVFQRIYLEDGGWKWLGAVYYRGLRAFGRKSTLGVRRRPVLTAP